MCADTETGTGPTGPWHQEAASAEAVREGVEITQKGFLQVLKRHGVAPIEAEVGDVFDPAVHEALFEVPVTDAEAGRVAQVTKTGFKLNERVIRPTSVGVTKVVAE